jgi:hypothetical protein
MKTETRRVYLARHIRHGYEATFDSDLSESCLKDEYVVIGHADAEFIIKDDNDQVAAVIAGLEAAKQKELADSQVRVRDFEERIQNLLALSHSA